MKNNVINLFPYQDNAHRRSRRSSGCNGMIRYWLITISETLVTLSISACTIFCMYLAYTML